MHRTVLQAETEHCLPGRGDNALAPLLLAAQQKNSRQMAILGASTVGTGTEQARWGQGQWQYNNTHRKEEKCPGSCPFATIGQVWGIG